MVRLIVVSIAVTFCALCMCNASAFGEQHHTKCVTMYKGPTGLCAPGWSVTARNYPTDLAPGHAGVIEVEVQNMGAGESGPVTVTDVLPKGLAALEAGSYRAGIIEEIETLPLGEEDWTCNGNEGGPVEGASIVTCTSTAGLLGGAGLAERGQLGIRVRTEAHAREDLGDPEDNHVVVAGGGAPVPASTSDPVTISSVPASSGFGLLDTAFFNANGTVDTQAGSHPYALMLRFDLATVMETDGELGIAGKDNLRNVEVLLPPGLIGDPGANPRCTHYEFYITATLEDCPPGSEIGEIWTDTTSFPSTLEAYNLVPPPGVPADIGFTFEHINASIEAGVRSGGDYGITVSSHNLPAVDVDGATIVLWGVPLDQTHDHWHIGAAPFDYEGCNISQEKEPAGICAPEPESVSPPFLTLPTACGAPLKFTIRATTWQHPDAAPIERSVYVHNSNDEPVGMSGCEKLGFAPSITVAPDTARTDTPTGLTVEVKPPVGGLEEPEGLSTADIQNTTVTLPEGLVINPGQAAGLQACGPAEDGLTSEVEKARGEEDNGPPSCPGASKLGTVVIKSPLIEGEPEKQFEGSVYLLQSNPPEVKLLMAASADGVNVKLVGTVHLNEQTGQVTTTFLGTPEIPFTDFKLSFSGGAQAALSTPTQCGTYGPAQGFGTDFTPWSSPLSADAFPSAQFALSEGPDGTPCPSGALPFSPSMTAGATTDQAGGYTDFSLLLNRADGQQRISKLQFKAPPGLLGMISHVTLCEEPQAASGNCPASSQIGHTTVGAGAGSYPLYIPEPGKPEAPIYVTGPYEGAPYGLSIVLPVQAGPFNLGTVVTRAKIEVDPQTAQLTITTDPLTTILKGVPANLRTINAVVDRPEFMFNPTNCNPQSFRGTATSIEGTTAPLSSPFKVESCRALVFKPTFKVATSAKTSRVDGASLHVTLNLPDEGGLSSEANVQRVKVSLPKQLPTPLKTLQKACLEKTFAEEPKNCPVASQVGQVRVTTPVLPGGLSGTAYFVSHGGAKYPELIFVLVGQNGVTVQVHGETQISKQGITTAMFNTVPDVPFSSFELTLPEREYPALTGNGNLCKAQTSGKLTMPTELAGQNGLVIKQSTKIAVTGCPKKATKKKTRHKDKRTHGKK